MLPVALFAASSAAAAGGSPFTSSLEQSRTGGGGPGTYAHYQFSAADKAAPSADMEMDHTWVAMPNTTESTGNAVFASTQYWVETGVGGCAKLPRQQCPNGLRALDVLLE